MRWGGERMPKRDLDTIDLAQQKLCLADDVMVWPVRECGELVYRLEIPSLHKFYRVGYAEYVLISLLDGNTTLPEACGLAAVELGAEAPTSAQASTIARWLVRNQLAFFAGQPAPKRSQESPGRGGSALDGSAGKTLLQSVNPFWLKIPLPVSGKWVPRFANVLKPLCSLRVLAGSLLVIFIAAWQFALHSEQFLGTSVDVFDKSNWIYLLLTWVLLKMAHELAHAVVCQRMGCEVREAGVVLVLLAPLAYVDVTSCWRLADRWKRIAVSAAGMYVELVIASLAFILWLNVTDVQSKFLLDNIVWMAGVSTLVFNLNVLMRFDGYYILCDLVEIPNLAGESAAAVQNLFRRWIVGQVSEPSRFSGWRRTFVLCYGFAALIWRIIICLSLTMAAAVMFSGAGIIVSLLGIYLWFASPAKRLASFCKSLLLSDPARAIRSGICSAFGIIFLYLLLFVVPLPTAINVPAIVEYTPETLVRSGANGFVRRIHVAEGQEVESGQLLVEIENDDLLNRLEQLEIKKQQCEIEISQAVNEHDAAQTYIHRKTMDSLAEKIANLKQQVQGMRVTSPCRGKVVVRDLDVLLGTFVEEGTHLMNVADDASKEIIAMIGQDEIDEVRGMVSSDVHVCTPDWKWSSGVLEVVEPQATNELAWRALAATEGGPLPIRQSREELASSSLRLLEPMFQARILTTGETSRDLPAGIRVTAAIGYRTDPIASRVGQRISRWWQDAKAGSRVE